MGVPFDLTGQARVTRQARTRKFQHRTPERVSELPYSIHLQVQDANLVSSVSVSLSVFASAKS